MYTDRHGVVSLLCTNKKYTWYNLETFAVRLRPTHPSLAKTRKRKWWHRTPLPPYRSASFFVQSGTLFRVSVSRHDDRASMEALNKLRR